MFFAFFVLNFKLLCIAAFSNSKNSFIVIIIIIIIIIIIFRALKIRCMSIVVHLKHP